MSGDRDEERGARHRHDDEGPLAGAWALDALDDDERAAYEERLRRDPAERLEADALRETASRLGAASAVPPPERLRASVLAAVAATAQEPPAGAAPVADLAVRRRRRRGPSRLSALVAAAGVVVAAAGAGVALDARGDAERAREVAAAQVQRERAEADTLQRVAALLSSPGASTATVPVTGGGTATLVRAGGEAAVVTAGLPAAGPGRAYQLWLVRGDDVAPAGLLPAAGGGDRAVALLPELGGATGFGISVEPAGGSRQPTTTPVVLTTLPA
ncbi:anti-sigma factor [Kineococcus sp. SYSU DK005]|uniref:anti-sigma factor n=1 Tax=Kineococcus sp. SYSU DK005 TaxID=3383126 RepID=UPI003D7C3BBD